MTVAEMNQPTVIKIKVRGREVFVLGAGNREILVSRADTKRKALAQLAAFVDHRCAELGV